MSQFPPNPGQPQTVPYQPPMQQAKPNNVMAIVSLICGIIGCLVITPIAGIITGVIALMQSKQKGGKGMAIAGIVLSVLWIGGGALMVGGTIWGVNKITELVANVGKQPAINLANDLVAGDIDAASKLTSMDKPELRRLSEKLQGMGKCTDITINSPNYQLNNGVETVSFFGNATFENGVKSFRVTVRRVSGQVTVEEFELR